MSRTTHPKWLTPTFSRWLNRNVVYPTVVFGRGEGSVFRRLQELTQRQWDPHSQIERRQMARVRALIAHAAHKSPFYAAQWHGQVPLTFHDQSLSLDSIKPIAKADVQDHWREMIARTPTQRVTKKTTGGSTGQAVTLLKNRAATAAEMAATWLGYSWFGIAIGDRAARFWGVPSSTKRRLRFALADVAMNRIRFSAFAFNDDDLERYWRRCEQFRPDYLYGYVSMIEAFAGFVMRRNYPAHELRLKAVVTTAEVLTAPQRKIIWDAFGCSVQNEYGCGEVGPIAYECEKASLHIMSENVLVEVLLPDGSAAAPGQTGEVVITDLNNVAMPLIRYRLGDMAVPGAPCACGRGLPTLERVWGRSYDFVLGPDNRRYHGEFFMYLFEDLRGRGENIRQFQVIKSGPDVLKVLVVSDDDVSAVVSQTLRQRLPGMNVIVSRTSSILRRASGKMQIIDNRWLGHSAAENRDRH